MEKDEKLDGSLRSNFSPFSTSYIQTFFVITQYVTLNSARLGFL